MRATSRSIALAALWLFMAGLASAAAQEPAPPPQPLRQGQAPALITPLEVEVVISRSQGNKDVSRVPYLLSVNAPGEPTQLNMGADVPIPSPVFAPAPAPAAGAGDKPAPAGQPFRSYNYRSIGTSITARANSAQEGRFELRLEVDESSVYTAPQAAGAIAADVPVFRNFRSRNTLLLRDGERRRYTAATDRVSGEVVTIEVMLRVVK